MHKKKKIHLHGMGKRIAGGVVLGAALCGAFAVATMNDCSDTATEGEKLADTESGAETPVYEDKMERTDEGYTLVWNDEFEGDTLDLMKWDYQYGTGAEYGLDGWGNSELEYYTDRPENVRVEDGRLLITAIKEDTPYEGMDYTSGRIRTMTWENEEIFSTTYGRIEARIKMPKGEGLWPAFWMLPVDESIYGGWAASGEIDIMEARGRLPGIVEGTLHYGKMWPNNTYKGEGYEFEEGTDITDYHLYSLEWEPGEMRWYVDNECFYTTNKWYSSGQFNGTDYTGSAPFDVPFYILFDLAVGGTFDAEADVTKAEFPATMEVDFVRVYHKTEGYGPSEVEGSTAVDSRDTAGYEQYAASYEDGEFIADKEFSTMNTDAIKNTDTGVVADNKDWQFAVGNFGGAATAAVEELAEGKFARVDITSGGNQTYAVQLIQHLPLVEGYSYQVSFDVKATEPRSFVVSPSGDGDNGWAKYTTYDGNAGTEVSNHNFVFKMNSTTDPTARLEFNLGQATGSIWIGNVSVTVVEAEGGVDDDMKKTPLTAGLLIYNGTFDQGEKRLAFWHAEDMEVIVPDYVKKKDGKLDYSRKAQLTATGANAKIYQTGLQLQANKGYFMRLDLSGENDAVVKVTITGEDGTVYLDEVCNYSSAEGKQRMEFNFTNPTDADAENATITISMPEGGTVNLDNVKMNKKLN